MAVVALRKESVDRNAMWLHLATVNTVALRKESVDRNWSACLAQREETKSLSARRAWIEIETMLPSWTRYAVALRKESVDRNQEVRRLPWQSLVALRKESVDRN